MIYESHTCIPEKWREKFNTTFMSVAHKRAKLTNKNEDLVKVPGEEKNTLILAT